ncbi:hypothetical protein A3A84_00770 [Candidatus Collierbacteria bacterium RIFCSPLOWO2_01_FULL_50_23]|uniref:Uncharacterized protein n=2 Tax=Candidatus Collieribacteriota TaxID=1752725 RepID=A0A1F5EXK6_9BACT|nr:MAG: hypothetical protein A2703_01490 [Candidatus Collierbacteria bacterium RIFCSPHIGHO2_01_FULL_50_25]OGD72097.1 MAG: hypothetical protein A3D09_03875 [Candidatus Collierbacteria bacterium RIFCSPHIGHO2_02_FULL_49_10]OGD74694.1 MAG: hypothetical protein A3A84_00770 [Candidatus Collierbacteria bacterium RIFCSPLOWO2_01_FULL_50_23]
MRARQKKYTSPIYLSLLHFLPSLLLLGLVAIGIMSLKTGEQGAVLGSQTTLPQIKTETVEDRLGKLMEVARTVKSEAVEQAEMELRN